jgi:MarR family transcriptional regulator, organic hydroperoxide resistance regulator
MGQDKHKQDPLEEQLDDWPVRILLRTANHVIQQYLTTYLMPLDLTPAGLTVLSLLARYGTLDQRELSRRSLVGEQSLGTTIERLEQLGHITRTRDDKDHRRNLVELTPSGREAWEKAHLDDPLYQVLHETPELHSDLQKNLAALIRLAEQARAAASRS